MSDDIAPKYSKRKLDYTTTIFFTLTPILTIIGILLYFLVYKQHLQTNTLILALVMYCLSGFSISMGYHRLFSHRTYQTNTLIKIILLFFGAGTFEQSAIVWAQYHRHHHTYTDTEQDPHSIRRGFFYAHIGWILRKSEIDFTNRDNVSDLLKDKWVMLQEKYYLPIAILSGWLLPIAIASLWHDFFGGLLFAAATRIILFNQATFCINSLTHTFGKQPYNTAISARDHFLVSLVTFGEGYHNYHHAYPYDYRNGRKIYNFDPSKWIIFMLSKVGLTKNLRRAA